MLASCPFSAPSHLEHSFLQQHLLFSHVRKWSGFLERFSCREEKNLFLDVEAPEVERPWVLKDPGFQMISSGLLRTTERLRMCRHKGFVCLCSCREELADIPNGRQEEARRGCSAMPLRWVSYWLWLTGSLASLEPWITEMQSCAFLGAGHWPTSHGSFTSWDNFPLLSWHIPSRALWVMGHRAQMLTKWKASLLSSLSGFIRNWYMNFASLSSGLHPSSQRRGL